MEEEGEVTGSEECLRMDVGVGVDVLMLQA